MKEPVVSPRGPVKIDATRLLRTPLGVQLLGTPLSADVYLRNGFRLLRTPASVDAEALEVRSQRFRALYRLNPVSALQAAMRTGYDGALNADDIRESIDALRNPRLWLLSQLFWPHLSPEAFERIRRDRDLTAPAVFVAVEQAGSSGSAESTVLAAHALAVVQHNRAIAHDCTFAAGKADWDDVRWPAALDAWARVIRLDRFWSYLQERVRRLDHPVVAAQDVDRLREQLPAAILNFNALFAHAYARAGAQVACARHVRYIGSSPFEAGTRRTILVAVAQVLLKERLEPLLHRARAELTPEGKKFKRKDFSIRCTPIVDQAFQLRVHLLQDLGLPADMVDSTEFDPMCDAVLAGLNGHIDYKNDDNARAVLYGALLAKRMRGLPISSASRRKLEQTERDHIEILYKGLLPNGLDPLRCWFLDGEEADPDACFEFPMHKVTHREVTVDHGTGSAGIKVHFETRRILVPRSATAAAVHAGKSVSEEIPEHLLTEEQRRIPEQAKRAERDGKAQVEAHAAERDQAIRRQQAACDHRLQVYNTALAKEIAVAEAAVTHARNERDAAIKKAEHLREATLRKITTERARDLGKAKARLDRVTAATAGLRGWPFIELPVAILVLASAISFAPPLAYETRGENVLVGWITLIALGSVLIFVIAIYVGRGIRATRRGVAGRLIRAYKRAERRVHSDFESARARAEKGFESVTAPLMRKIEKGRDKIRKERDDRIAAIEKKYKDVIENLQHATKMKVEQLRAQLRRKRDAKPERAKHEFPALSRARMSAGYRDGEKPSQSEMEMSYAEQQEALRRLGRLW